MATVTGLTAARMIAMENATIIDGSVVGNNLHLQTRDGTDIDAGNVRGPIGPSGSGFQICTSTTRPTMLLADEGKAIYETDTDLVRIWTGTRWKVQERVICTDTTRPSLGSADEGVAIYETNTNMEYVWTGTAWYPTRAIAPSLWTFAAEPLTTTLQSAGTISAGTWPFNYKVLVNVTFKYWAPNAVVLDAVRFIGIGPGNTDIEMQGLTYVANSEHFGSGQFYSKDMNAGQAATFQIQAYTLTPGGGIRSGVACATIIPR